MLLAFLLNCSTISVNQDYDSSYDFSQLKTFGFLPLPQEAGIDQLSANRLGDAIKNELQANGYSVSGDNADFGVAMHFGQNTKTDIQSWRYGYGAWHRRALEVRNAKLKNLWLCLVYVTECINNN